MNASAMKEILEHGLFHHVFQPLYELKNDQVIGYESLLRVNNFDRTEDVFRTAREHGCLFDLDTSSVTNAVMHFSKYNLFKRQCLFVNLFPSTLQHPSFLSFSEKLLNTFPFDPSDMVIEINENEVIQNPESLKEMISFLKHNGFQIAIDDVGKGSASFQNIIEIEPDVIKLDKYFSKNLQHSLMKQEAVKVFVHFSSEAMKVVLEGIETKEDLEMAKELGVDIGQGFYLDKPAPLGQFATQDDQHAHTATTIHKD
ncbi:EAL domain-containing protein (putative c-di-GMP-specific phosphodiesterase class I) [Melghiribacillus thermohalophilus]|uniref:EAL domain-containing protein (Putative c-di-GMP-specific phosphodiesterase class I) n=1 Tax=Melghiribacillus thermohalophilus TaxID=1324956 RepID=A0A4R3ND18_9BACI|nr:EAL domain-containing protein [Melghiribacillus thermohalophilus]TCT25083.1 EAL domain-containing protein (putative c-di-GMP-specific phosphodiesterase class I) [Melghiribacillus thermohalophilus]